MMKWFAGKVWPFCLVVWVLGLLCVPCLLAPSSYTSQLSGVVTDSSGAVIPGIKVTLTDEATAVGTASVTYNRGIYFFTGMRPATYSIRVEAPGFTRQERKSWCWR